jgi:hypothetical protein
MVAGVQWFGWLLSILAALLLTGFQYYWLIQSARNKTLTERRWVFPVIFRFTAWILLFLLIQGPWITLHSVIESKPRVILYLDSSESVSRNDKKRIAIAAEKLAELLPSWHVERYYFGADVWRGTNGDTARSINNGWVKSTNFQRLFEHQRQERFKYGLEAAVIMTDGIANDGLSTQSLRSPEGVLVSGIGVGDTNQYADVVVKSLWLNKEIFVGDTIYISSRNEVIPCVVEKIAKKPFQASYGIMNRKLTARPIEGGTAKTINDPRSTVKA